jgi:non-ribosomal peptide synthetase component F
MIEPAEDLSRLLWVQLCRYNESLPMHDMWFSSRDFNFEQLLYSYNIHIRSLTSTSNPNITEPCPIHQDFHTTALNNPTSPALIDSSSGKIYTYHEVQYQVLSLAKELRDAGCTRETVVGIYMDPCPMYVVAMLAVLSAGGAVCSCFRFFLFLSYNICIVLY